MWQTILSLMLYPYLLVCLISQKSVRRVTDGAIYSIVKSKWITETCVLGMVEVSVQMNYRALSSALKG